MVPRSLTSVLTGEAFVMLEADMSTSRGRGRGSIVLSFMLAFAGATMLGAAPVSAGNGVLTNFEFSLNNSCVRGFGAPPNSDIKVTLRGPDGNFQGSFVHHTGGDGSWDSRCFWGDINAGDKLIAKVGSSTRTFVVPPLSYTINRVTDVIAGKTAPNSELTFYVWSYQTSWQGTDVPSRDRVSNNKGKFSTDYSNTYDIRGNDQVEVDLYTAQGDIIYRGLDVPNMNVGSYYSEMYGDAKPNTDVTAWLFNSQGSQIAKFRDHSDWWDGEWGGKFGGHDILPGMYVGSDVASDALWKVFDMNPDFNTSADTIDAKCWKNKLFYVYASNIDNNNSMYVDGLTDGNGNISILTTDHGFDLRSDDTVEIGCRHPLGDEQDFIFEVP